MTTGSRTGVEFIVWPLLFFRKKENLLFFHSIKCYLNSKSQRKSRGDKTKNKFPSWILSNLFGLFSLLFIFFSLLFKIDSFRWYKMLSLLLYNRNISYKVKIFQIRWKSKERTRKRRKWWWKKNWLQWTVLLILLMEYDYDALKRWQRLRRRHTELTWRKMFFLLLPYRMRGVHLRLDEMKKKGSYFFLYILYRWAASVKEKDWVKRAIFCSFNFVQFGLEGESSCIFWRNRWNNGERRAKRRMKGIGWIWFCESFSHPHTKLRNKKSTHIHRREWVCIWPKKAEGLNTLHRIKYYNVSKWKRKT